MAQKLTARSALTTPASEDIMHVVDDPTGTPASYKSTLSNISKGLVAGNIPNTPAGAIAATDIQAAITELDTEKLALAGGTMTGDIQMGETSIKLDATLSGDGTWSGITTSGVSGVTTLAIGDLIYLNANDSRWELVDANLADGYDKLIGMALTVAADGAALEVLLYGKIRSAVLPAGTVGSAAYMGETAGDIVLAAPTTASAAVRKVGHFLTAEDFLFNPSSTIVVLAA